MNVGVINEEKILYLFTVGLFGFGWIIDMIRIAAGAFTGCYGQQLR